MKNLISFILIFIFTHSAYTQQKYYSADGKSGAFTNETIMLNFSDGSSLGKIEKQELAGAASFIPMAIDLGSKIIVDGLKKRKEKFVAEYSLRNSYLQDYGNIPVLHVERKLDGALALNIVLKPLVFKEGDLNALVYFIEHFEVNKYKAKTSRKSSMDYTIQLTPTVLVDDDKKQLSLSSISIKGLKSFDKTSIEAQEKRYRTDIIFLDKINMFTEFDVQIVESNPAKVKAEKFIDTYEKYEDERKSILEKILEVLQKDTQTEDYNTSISNDGVTRK